MFRVKWHLVWESLSLIQQVPQQHLDSYLASEWNRTLISIIGQICVNPRKASMAIFHRLISYLEKNKVLVFFKIKSGMRSKTA